MKEVSIQEMDKLVTNQGLAIALIIIIVVVAIVAFGLFLKERKEDREERRQDKLYDREQDESKHKELMVLIDKQNNESALFRQTLHENERLCQEGHEEIIDKLAKVEGNTEILAVKTNENNTILKDIQRKMGD